MTTIVGTDANPVATNPPCDCDTPVPPTPVIPTSGLVLHMDAALGLSKTGSNVTAWVDQSDNAYSFSNLGTPTYVASSTGGLPAVHVSSGNKMVHSGAILSLHSPCDVFVVFKLAANAGGVLLGVGTDTAGFNPDFQYQTNRYVHLNWFGTAAYSTDQTDYANTSHLYRLNWTSADNLTYYLDGVRKNVFLEVGAYPGPDGGTTTTIGGFSGNTARDTDAEIAEIILYNRKLTDDEAADVTTILQAKYSLV